MTMKDFKTEFRPTYNNVLVKPNETPKTTPGGLALPNGAGDRPQVGVVVSVGLGEMKDDGERKQMEVSRGDTVVFSTYAGESVELEGTTFKLFKESDILLVKRN